MNQSIRLTRVLLIFFVTIGITTFLATQASGQIGRITINKLLEYLNHPQFLILDVRTSQRWQDSDKKIKGAVRANPAAFDSWSNELPKDKLLVLY